MIYVIYGILIGFIGFSFAIKTWILFQALVCVGLLSWIHKANEGLEGLPVFVCWLVFSIGMLMGDIFYYVNFYHGSNTIASAINWFLKP